MICPQINLHIRIEHHQALIEVELDFIFFTFFLHLYCDFIFFIVQKGILISGLQLKDVSELIETPLEQKALLRQLLLLLLPYPLC